jgi:hypothetical protein
MPQTPDEFAAALFVLIVLGALLIVGVGRLVVWVVSAVERRRAVNDYARATADYVAPPAKGAALVPPFPQEREPERERERAERPAEPPPPLVGKVYTPEQIATLTGQAEERGRAEALGMLLGRLLLDENDRAVAMELLFGPRGRKHQRVRPLVDAAAAQVAPPPEPARLIGVNEGKEGYIEL